MAPRVARIGCGAWGRTCARKLAAAGAPDAVSHIDAEAATAAAQAAPVRDTAPLLANPAIGAVALTPAARIGRVGHAGERLVSAASGTYTCARSGRRSVESAPETRTEIT
jgi:3-hydroxyisobutyrate dehydrogenase-like beta-hydroxyacid dehydrogenase